MSNLAGMILNKIINLYNRLIHPSTALCNANSSFVLWNEFVTLNKISDAILRDS